MTDHESVFTIGVLAEAAGVSPPTIRYYEEIKLIPPARRSAAGHRHYTREDIDRLTFIRRCRDFGAEHLAAVQARVAELRSLERQLQEFVGTCEDACCGGPGRDCVVLAELTTN